MRSKNTLAALVALALVALCGSALLADVKTKERTQFKFEGMLGRMVGLFGGKGARDGIVSTVAVKGDRKMTSDGDTGEIIDLAEEKIYQLDLDKKTYRVVTFEELRRQMREAEAKAREEAKKAQKDEKGKEPAEEPQVEIDFDMKETGQTKSLSGHTCREVLMTVTVRQKGKTLDQAGGLVLSNSSWLAPEIAALKSETDFDIRYAKRLYGETVSVEAMQQMAAAMAMYPGMKDAMERMQKENVNLSGSPLLTTMKFEAVKGQEQIEQEKREGTSSEDKPSGIGGLGGLLARKMAKKKEAPAEGQAANRATIMTSTVEVLQISPDVSAADVALPAGFRQEK